MYQEVVKYPERSTGESIALIACMVVGVLAVSLLSGLLRQFGLPLVDFLAFGVVVAVAAVVLKRRVVEYRYAIIGDELIITRLMGRREKTLASLPLQEVEAYAPYVRGGEKLRQLRFTICTRRLKVSQVILRLSGCRTRVLLQPSHRLDQMIRDAVPPDALSKA